MGCAIGVARSFNRVRCGWRNVPLDFLRGKFRAEQDNQGEMRSRYVSPSEKKHSDDRVSPNALLASGRSAVDN
jgi:hypothetical protein